MVNHGIIKSTEFVEMIDLKFVETVSKNPYIFDTVLRFVMNCIQVYTPQKLRDGLNDQLFEIMTDFVKKCEKKDVLLISKNYLISFAHTHKSISILKDIYEQTYELHSKITLSLADKWRIFFKINQIDTFTKIQKELYKDHLMTIDTTNTKKVNTMKYEAVSCCNNNLETLWEKSVSLDRNMSYTELTSFLNGLVERTDKSDKACEIKGKFLNWLKFLMEKDQKINAMTFFNHGKVKSEDLDFWINSLSDFFQTLDSKYEHFISLIRKEIESLKKKKKAYSLFE